jgi:hypothetical protein
MVVGATVAAAVLSAAAPALARESLSGFAPLSATGAISISWHGDPARGCAAAGLCGYRGSLSVRPSEGQLQFYAGRRGFHEAFGYTNVDSPPVIRVQRGSEGACVDLASTTEVEVFVRRVAPGRVRVGLANYELGPGRCAGPSLEYVVERLPKRTLPLRLLRHGRTAIALPGRRRFADGRFSGTVESTLRLRVGRVRAQRLPETGDHPRPRRSGRRARIAEVRARYRVTGLSGKLTTSFGGLAAPFCTNLDACGVTGSSSWAILSAGGTVLVEGGALARPGDRGLSGALAAISRRKGRLRGVVATDGRLRHALGATTATVRRPGGPDCRDAHSAQAPDFSTSVAHSRIVLELGGEGGYTLGGDLVRTGCPGPRQSEVLRDGGVAHGSLPLSALRRRSLEVPLRSPVRRFRDLAYSGARRAHFTVGLRRVALRVRYRSVRLGR